MLSVLPIKGKLLSRVGISVSADIEYWPISAVQLVPIYRPICHIGYGY